MSFVIDKEELKPGLIIFRRGDVDHKNWYCRVKLPKADRYKTISLKTSDVTSARERAYDEETDIRYRLKHGVAVFNRPFSDVAKEYADLLDERAKGGEITQKRAGGVRSAINCQLNRYIGTTQIHLIGKDRWTAYPAWRRAAAPGRVPRTGHTRPFTSEERAALEAKGAPPRSTRRHKGAPITEKTATEWVMVSDSTIATEMKAFRAIMAYAIEKKYASSDHAFGELPDLEVMRRDEFSTEEYRALHTRGRAWVNEADPANLEDRWLRSVVYLFVLIMCNTGMRPPEAANLRWSDISQAKDRNGQDIVVVYVRGKDKQRKLVATKAVGEYFERLKRVCQELRPNVEIHPEDQVFTHYDGKPRRALYIPAVRTLLEYAKLLNGPSGAPRSTYCFRHTYATFRLSSGIDVYFLAEQMGTSVQMIEQHYGHVNTIKNAHLVLQGMNGWDPPPDEIGDAAKPNDLIANRVAADRQAIRLTQPSATKPKRARR